MDWTNIRPRGNRILMELDESPHTFADGRLIIARVSEDGVDKLFPQRGICLTCGPDVNDIEPGDRVVGTKYNGVLLPRSLPGPNGHPLVLIKEDFILFKIGGEGEIKWGVSYTRSPRSRKATG